jgi:hypothetical protein
LWIERVSSTVLTLLTRLIQFPVVDRTHLCGIYLVDLTESVLYRMAYGLASQLREADAQNFPGRWRSSRAAGGSLAAIVAEVAEAGDDALGGRRPRW